MHTHPDCRSTRLPPNGTLIGIDAGGDFTAVEAIHVPTRRKNAAAEKNTGNLQPQLVQTRIDRAINETDYNRSV